MQIHCLKCKRATDTKDVVNDVDKRGKSRVKGRCSDCNTMKYKYVKSGGSVDIHKAISKVLPKDGLHLPGHRYTGPGTDLNVRLDENDDPRPGYEPFNQIDEISMKHDICYRDMPTGKHRCDENMLDSLKKVKPQNFREKVDRALVRSLIGTKYKLGLGVQKKRS